MPKRNLTAPNQEKSSGIWLAFMYFLLIRNCKAKQNRKKGYFLLLSACVSLYVSACVYFLTFGVSLGFFFSLLLFLLLSPAQ